MSSKNLLDAAILAVLTGDLSKLRRAVANELKASPRKTNGATCATCTKAFHISKSAKASRIKRSKSGDIYCSRSCQIKGQHKHSKERGT